MVKKYATSLLNKVEDLVFNYNSIFITRRNIIYLIRWTIVEPLLNESKCMLILNQKNVVYLSMLVTV